MTARHPTACANIEFRKAVWICQAATVDLADHYRRQLPNTTEASRVLTTPVDRLRLGSLIATRAAGLQAAVRLVIHLTKQQLASTEGPKRKELEAGYVDGAKASFDSVVMAMLEFPPTEADHLVQLQVAISRQADGEVGRIMNVLFSTELEI